MVPDQALQLAPNATCELKHGGAAGDTRVTVISDTAPIQKARHHTTGTPLPYAGGSPNADELIDAQAKGLPAISWIAPTPFTSRQSKTSTLQHMRTAPHSKLRGLCASADCMSRLPNQHWTWPNSADAHLYRHGMPSFS
jgi:hypothetical protein